MYVNIYSSDVYVAFQYALITMVYIQLLEKILNVKKVTDAQIRKNKVIQDIIQILTLKMEKSTLRLSFWNGCVMIMTDQVSIL